MKNYLKLMRIKHYIKNFLIFLPLIFSANFFNMNLLLKTIFSFFAFSFSSSIVYIINDIKDKENDKLHEIKKNRPIASGKISIKNAIILVIILFILVILMQYLSVGTFKHISYVYIFIYIIINLFYSFGLKNIPLLDIAILVVGFIIRVIYGASIINVLVSHWLYLTIMAASFYLGLGKRRNEISKLGTNSRKVLEAYNVNFLDKNMYMCLAIAIVFYALWTVESNNRLLIWTVPIVIIILMKYSMIVENNSVGDPVDVVFSDKLLLISIFMYGLLLMLIIYLGGLV